jgi:dynactin complex subunit
MVVTEAIHCSSLSIRRSPMRGRDLLREILTPKPRSKVRKIRVERVRKKKLDTRKKTRTLTTTAKKAREMKSTQLRTREKTLESFRTSLKELKKQRASALEKAKKLLSKFEATEVVAAKLVKVTENGPWVSSDYSPRAQELIDELTSAIESAFDDVISQVQDGLDSTEGDWG